MRCDWKGRDRQPAGRAELHRAERADRVTPAGSDFLVRTQAVPLTDWIVLVDANFRGCQAIGFEVLGQVLFGLERHMMIHGTPIPKNDLLRDAEHPADGVDDFARLAALELWIAAELFFSGLLKKRWRSVLAAK